MVRFSSFTFDDRRGKVDNTRRFRNGGCKHYGIVREWLCLYVCLVMLVASVHLNAI